MQHILVIDDPINSRLLRFLLEDEGYQVAMTTSLDEALERVADFNLIVLETALPGMDGLEFCRHIRQRSLAPTIILSERREISDIVAGFHAGADDYLTKPYDPNEAVARIWALLRRSMQPGKRLMNLRTADLIIDPLANKVTLARSGQTIVLSPLETRLLQVLMSQSGHSMTREALVIKVWGYEYDLKSNQLEVYIARLRSKIEADPKAPQLIQTVRNTGYRFMPGAGPA